LRSFPCVVSSLLRIQGVNIQDQSPRRCRNLGNHNRRSHLLLNNLLGILDDFWAACC
jgi:hypothetical protein